MSALGVGVDREKQLAFATEYQKRSNELLLEFQTIAGTDVNPNSVPQLKKLLYEDARAADPRIAHDGVRRAVHCRACAAGAAWDGARPARRRRSIHALLGVPRGGEAARHVHRTRGGRQDRRRPAYPCRLTGAHHVAARESTLAGGEARIPEHAVCPQEAAGHVHARAGQRLGRGRLSAVELRMIALLANDEILIEAFKAFDEKRGPDVHMFNACGLFRCQPHAVTNDIRNFVKRFVYALYYDAQPPTIYQTLSLLRDDKLSPMFPHLTLPEVERPYNAWWKLHPSIPDWKKRLIQSWRARGYIATEYHKRKRFFIGGESATEMGNLPIQGASADMQNDAIRAVVSMYPFNFEKRRGLSINGHDQIVVECGEDEVDDVKRIIQVAMQKRIGAMLFPADPKAAKTGRRHRDRSELRHGHEQHGAPSRGDPPGNYRRLDCQLLTQGMSSQRTYRYSQDFSAWLVAHGQPFVTMTRWWRKDGSFVPISALCLARGDLPSKAYGLSGCTSKWKQQPIDKLVKEHAGVQVAWARGELVERWIGYDAGEPERSERMLAKNPQPTRIRNGKVEMLPRWRSRTPLVEWDMGREECVRAIQDAGLPLPGKSACFHCPSTTKREIDRMVVEEPEMLKRALAIEDNARAGMTSVKGLGRRFSWREYLGRTCACR